MPPPATASATSCWRIPATRHRKAPSRCSSSHCGASISATASLRLDCGANIGVHTVEWAKGMTGWGFVIAYRGAGADLLCARRQHLDQQLLQRPCDPCRGRERRKARCAFRYRTIWRRRVSAASSSGSPSANEFIGQDIDYSEPKLATIRLMTINSLNLSRLDLIKIDVERMELEVLQGAKATIERFRPIIIVEQLKASKDEITAVLASYGYEWFALGLNFLAVHPSDPTRQAISVAQPGTAA